MLTRIYTRLMLASHAPSSEEDAYLVFLTKTPGRPLHNTVRLDRRSLTKGGARYFGPERRSSWTQSGFSVSVLARAETDGSYRYLLSTGEEDELPSDRLQPDDGNFVWASRRILGAHTRCEPIGLPRNLALIESSQAELRLVIWYEVETPATTSIVSNWYTLPELKSRLVDHPDYQFVQLLCETDTGLGWQDVTP